MAIKKIIYVLLLLFIGSCQRQPKKKEVGYKIIGQIKNAPDSISVIISNQQFRDSTLLISGNFSFSGVTDMPQLILLTVKNAPDGKHFWLENTHITFNGDYNNLDYAELTGGEIQEISNVLWDRKKTTLKLMGKIDSLLKNDSLGKFQRDSILGEGMLLSDKLNTIEKNFAKEYPSTLDGVFLLALNRSKWDRDSVGTIFSTMDNEIKNTKYGLLISEYLELPINPKIGEKYIDVSLLNTDDEIVALSQLTGTITLIDFWASWCVPCREENPNLVELFEKYNENGLNIISVSMDSDKSKWLKAIEDDGLPWANLTDNRDLLSNNIFSLYDIRFLPDNLLVNEDGIIIARNIRGNKLRDSLKVLFNF